MIDPITGAAIIGAGASLWSGSQSAKAQKKANKLNEKMTWAQMEFQERMSRKAHRYQVEDLKAAGLNPMLSVNTGASTPGGASMQAITEDGEAQGIENSVNSALQTVKLKNDVKMQKAQIQNIAAQTAKTAKETGIMEKDAVVADVKAKAAKQAANRVLPVLNNAAKAYDKATKKDTWKTIQNKAKELMGIKKPYKIIKKNKPKPQGAW